MQKIIKDIFKEILSSFVRNQHGHMRRLDVNGQVLVGWAQQVVGDAADLQDHRLS